MSKTLDYKELRINHNNSWPNVTVNYPCEAELETLIKDKGFPFTSFKFLKIEEKFFQKNLSYLLDALDNLPLRPDLAFDNIWKVIDNYLQTISHSKHWNIRKANALMDRTVEEVWMPLLNKNEDLKNSFKFFINMIPVQTCEYLAKRAIADRNPGISKNQQDKVSERVEQAIDKELYRRIKIKYKDFDGEQQRNCARLFRKLILGEKIEIKMGEEKKGKEFKLDEKDIVLLLVKGITYTYRNERFHGETFSPFRSSVSSLKTYAHAYFLFLYAYFLLLMLLCVEYSREIDISNIVENIQTNSSQFENLFKDFINQ